MSVCVYYSFKVSFCVFDIICGRHTIDIRENKMDLCDAVILSTFLDCFVDTNLLTFNGLRVSFFFYSIGAGRKIPKIIIKKKGILPTSIALQR